MESFSFLTKKTKRASRAFTLIELIVVVAIILVVTSVVLVNQNSFNRTLLLTDTAYTVALSVREAQSLGLSSQKSTVNGTSVQNAGYGVHFQSDSPSSYIQFADISNSQIGQTSQWCPVGTGGLPDAKPGDCIYNGAGEQVQKYIFNQGFVINSFCAYTGSSNTLLGCSNSGNPLYALDVTFLRPNTNSIITITYNSGAVLQATTACIQVAAPGGNFRYVKITQLGQVSVTPSCP